MGEDSKSLTTKLEKNVRAFYCLKGGVCELVFRVNICQIGLQKLVKRNDFVPQFSSLLYEIIVLSE